MSKKVQTDTTLIDGFIDGDQKAFVSLAERYKDEIYNTVFYFLGSRVSKDRAEALTQEVFLEVYNNVQNLQERYLFAVWLYQLAVNICNIELTRIRQGQGENYTNPEEEMDYLFKRKLDDLVKGSFTKFRSKEYRDLVFQAIELLPDELRIVFVLRVILKLEYEDMSAILDQSEEILANRVFLAKIKLKKMLK